MDLTHILSLVSGVAFFLYGMTVMGNGLKRVAGSRLEGVLWHLSSTPFRGFLLGIGVAGVIQSSSATSVMVVSFINAGMLKLPQAVSIILGANVGTTMTGWLLTLSGIGGGGAVSALLSTTALVAVLAVTGIIMDLFMKKNTFKHLGTVFLGLAVLLTSMTLISQAVEPLKDSETFRTLLVRFQNPVFGILAGVLVAAVLQSSSAAVGILQALSVTGAIPYAVCLPLILGINIGAAAPVMFSMLGSGKNGKRAALSYLFSNVAGLVIIYAVYAVAAAVTDLSFLDSASDKMGIAVMNSAIRVAVAVILLPCHRLIVSLVCKLVKSDESDSLDTTEIDSLTDGLLEYTPVALEKASMAVNKMTELSFANVRRAIELISGFDRSQLLKIQEQETLTDKYEDKVSTFVVKIGKHSLTHRQQLTVSQLLSAVGDLERLSDHALNIAESAQELYEKKIAFSDRAVQELDLLIAAVLDVMNMAETAFLDRNPENCDRIEALEEVIDELCKLLRSSHIDRVRKAECRIETGFVFSDLLTNLERVSDHCSNLGFCVAQGADTSLGEHEFSESVISGARFKTAFENYRRVYLNALKSASVE